MRSWHRYHQLRPRRSAGDRRGLVPKSLELAERRADVYEFGDSISFYQADAESLASYIPGEQYDLVTPSESSITLRDPSALFSRCVTTS